MGESLFTVAGFSKDFISGERTMRFSNGDPRRRSTHLAMEGHTNIYLMPLPKPMSKMEALAFIIMQHDAHVHAYLGLFEDDEEDMVDDEEG